MKEDVDKELDDPCADCPELFFKCNGWVCCPRVNRWRAERDADAARILLNMRCDYEHEHFTIETVREV